MSDEPKKRSPARIWTLRTIWSALALLVLYLLLAGPAHWFALWCSVDDDLAYTTFNVVYKPLWWVEEQSETFEDWIDWYLGLWVPSH